MQQSTNHSLSFPREALPSPIHHFPIINKGALQQALAPKTTHSSLQILNDLAGWKARPTVELGGSQTWLPIRHTWGFRLECCRCCRSCCRLWSGSSQAELQVCAFKALLASGPWVGCLGQLYDGDRRESCNPGTWEFKPFSKVLPSDLKRRSDCQALNKGRLGPRNQSQFAAKK